MILPCTVEPCDAVSPAMHYPLCPDKLGIHKIPVKAGNIRVFQCRKSNFQLINIFSTCTHRKIYTDSSNLAHSKTYRAQPQK